VPANVGTGLISTGSYSAPPNFLPEAFDLTFAVGGGGQLEYTATGRVSGAIVAGPTVYQDGADITFSGVSLNISGAPSAGDAFVIEPSTSQDLFTSLQNVIDAVDSFVDTAAGRAELANKIGSEQSSIDRGMTNIDRIRAKIGSRLNAIDSEEFSNLTLLLNSKSALSDIEDLDIIEASTRLSQQVTVLEAAQASYIRVQGLSLFNFL
jgi:flagellar hook-associated protein 3 FlgL